jgi:hypothetical protein
LEIELTNSQEIRPKALSLQYQKKLRLQEARQLMLKQNLDAGSAGGRVGL